LLHATRITTAVVSPRFFGDFDLVSWTRSLRRDVGNGRISWVFGESSQEL